MRSRSSTSTPRQSIGVLLTPKGDQNQGYKKRIFIPSGQQFQASNYVHQNSYKANSIHTKKNAIIGMNPDYSWRNAHEVNRNQNIKIADKSETNFECDYIMEIYRQYFDTQPSFLPQEPIPLIKQLFSHIHRYPTKMISSSNASNSSAIYSENALKQLDYEKKMKQNNEHKYKQLKKQYQQMQEKLRKLEILLQKSEQQLFTHKKNNQELNVNMLMLKKQLESCSKNLRKQQRYKQISKDRYDNVMKTLRVQLAQTCEQRDDATKQCWAIKQENQKLYEQLKRLRDIIDGYSNQNSRQKSQISFLSESNNKNRKSHCSYPNTMPFIAGDGQKSDLEKQCQKMAVQLSQLKTNQSSLLDRLCQRDILIQQLQATIDVLKEDPLQNSNIDYIDNKNISRLSNTSKNNY